MKKEYLAQIKTIGLRVKELRITKNMTQQNLAGYCDVDIRTIQRIEKGEHAFAIETLFSLADALQIEPQKLLEIYKRKVDYLVQPLDKILIYLYTLAPSVQFWQMSILFLFFNTFIRNLV